MEAVSSHMRILIGISGERIITAAPSEPILAVVAGYVLTEVAELYRGAIGTLLDKLINRGLVHDRGRPGYLCTPLLLMMARDTTEPFLKMSHDGVEEVTALRLSRFLQKLLGDDLGIPNADGEQMNLRNQLLQDIDNFWINFTHFVKLTVPVDQITTFMLCEAWSSGYAFQYASHQPVIGGLIVIYCGDIDGSFNPTNLFVVPWQTKAKSQPPGIAVARQLTAPFLLENDSIRSKHKHVAILVDLAAHPTFGFAEGPLCQLICGKAERPKEGDEKGGENPQGTDWDGETETEAERYCLRILGYGTGQYPVLHSLDVERMFEGLFKRSLVCGPDFLEFAEKMETATDRVNLVK
jgi:hypothetical protein